jgi:glyoxylase-like metal-dependent hydrolase (beta-lactamase superfamily II)
MAAMPILERTEHPQWLSNAYLLADNPGGHGVVIDANDRVDALIEAARRHDVTVDAILLTHEHHDHVAGLDRYRAAFDAPVVAHPSTAALIGDVERAVQDGETVVVGDLTLRAIHTPGHAAGHVAFATGSDVFTGDVLFKRTVGGTRAPGATGFADLRASVQRLIALPASTAIHPGHRASTTVAAEREENPFVRVWSGLDAEGAERCRVRGVDATLVLWAPDYDGGHKAWVRFDDGEDAIVGGSQVQRTDA